MTLLPGVGNITAKNLLAYCGSAEEVFRTKKKQLEKIPGIGTVLIDVIGNGEVQADVLKRAEEEISFMERNHVEGIFFTDIRYPKRLKQCADSPILLYVKGKMDLNAERIVSVIGSRKATAYGRKICEQIIDGFVPYGAFIVSGLAYGIDICAHRASLKNNLSTAGVLAHGLDIIYPGEHSQTAEKMTLNGGLISEFMSHTKMNPEYFPRRNRIVAGISDATIVIEATYKSGALITAEIANSYDREVFAVPGKVDEPSSEGCNLLIKANKAMLIQSAEDVVKALNWDVQAAKPRQSQQELFANLSSEEELIVNLLKEKGNIHIDDLSVETNLPMNKTASLLLNLEFSGVIKSLPGKMYELNT